MREICTSGSTSGRWKRGTAGLVRHRQTKEPDTDRPYLNHLATSRLYLFRDRMTISCVRFFHAGVLTRQESRSGFLA
jgi:hypothetical protein